MSKQVLVGERTYNRLLELKHQYRSKGLGKVIDKLIDIHDTQFKDPRLMALQDIKYMIDKWHYVFSPEDTFFLEQLPALIRAPPKNKAVILKNLADGLEETIKGQEQLK